jgi:curli biogenesis system outer membrane secretion channel CsgG
MPCPRPLRLPVALTYLALALLCGGCAAPGSGNPADYVQPTIAVMKFENRAPAVLGWDLGSGTRDVLVDRLMRTGRYHVIERPEIASIMGELKFQQSGVTRPQDKAAAGQIKNVQYLIKGTVTDFGIVGGINGGAGKGSLGLFAGDTKAVMGIIMYVVEVESGEIIASQSIQEAVHSSEVDVRAAYKDVAFGGGVFSRTPLGEATAKVIDRSVDKITTTIASRPWVPRIAHVEGDGTVILNGGSQRGLKTAQELEVFTLGAPIADPDTGDVIAHQNGQLLGRLRITEVQDRYSMASIVTGKAEALQVGQRCRKVQ